MLKPNSFTKHPFDSVSQSYNSEVIARNIMIILSKTGNEWRRLTYQEYKCYRLKEGNWTPAESLYFEEVLPHTTSPGEAINFCKTWASEPAIMAKGNQVTRKNGGGAGIVKDIIDYFDGLRVVVLWLNCIKAHDLSSKMINVETAIKADDLVVV